MTENFSNKDNYAESSEVLPYLRVGSNCAFGSWKLMWNDGEGNCCMADIPAKTAKMLISSGLPHEG